MVFCQKMKADYYWYVAENTLNTQCDVKKQAEEQARVAYAGATAIACAEFPVTHPIRLGLALNYSVFLYYVVEDIDGGYGMARRAFDMARPAFKDVLADGNNAPSGADDSYKDAVRIMHSLGHILQLWKLHATRYYLTYKRDARMALMPCCRGWRMSEDGEDCWS